METFIPRDTGALAGSTVGFGFWIALSKAIAKNILIATIAIVEMKSPIVDLPGDARDIACDVIKGIASEAGASRLIIVDAFLGAATGDAPTDCF